MPPRVVVIGVRDVVFDRHGLGETGQVVDVWLQLLAEVSLVTKGNTSAALVFNLDSSA